MRISERMSSYLSLFLCLSSGALATLGFFFPGAYFWTIVGFAVFFWLLASEKRPLWGSLFGFSFGLAYFAFGLSWVFPSVYVHGNAPWLFSVFAVLALSGVLSIFPTLVGFLSTKISTTPAVKTAFVLPLLWTCFEFLRGEWICGFGWLSTGYAFVDNLLSEYAPLLGGYGVGLVVLLVTGGACAVFLRQEGRAIRLLAGFVSALLVVGAYFLQNVQWSSPAERLEVRLVQPDLAVTTRATFRAQASALERVRSMSEMRPMGRPLDLIIWPESVYAFLPQRLPDSWVKVPRRVAEAQTCEVLYNAFSESGRNAIFNSIFLATESQESRIYSKRHLVPFGERVPFGFRWLINALGIPMADQQVGSPPSAEVRVAGVPVALGICYENLFAGELRDWFLVSNPQFVVYSANLGWFAESVVGQFTQMSRMRARESARPVLQIVNNSGSALLDAGGGVERLAGRGAQNLDVLFRSTSGELTPFMQYGFSLLFAFGLLLFATVFLICRLARCFSRKSLD